MTGTDAIVDTYLLAHREFRRGSQAHTRTGWRASSLGYCPRRQVYERVGVPKPDVDVKTLRTFAYGDMVHDWLKGILRRSGMLLAEEGTLAWPERQLKGHYDVLLASSPEPVEAIPAEVAADWSQEWVAFLGELRRGIQQAIGANLHGTVLGEIKSMHSRAIKYAYEQGPQKGHTYQVGAYWLMAKADPTQLPAVPDTARLIYVGKDASGILDFGMEAAWAERAEERLALLNDVWGRWALPPCICGTEGELPSRYCAYYDEQAKSCCSPALMPGERGEA